MFVIHVTNSLRKEREDKPLPKFIWETHYGEFRAAFPSDLRSVLGTLGNREIH